MSFLKNIFSYFRNNLFILLVCFHYGQENYFMISILYHLLETVLFSSIWPILVNLPCVFGNIVHSVVIECTTVDLFISPFNYVSLRLKIKVILLVGCKLRLLHLPFKLIILSL